MGPVFSEEQCRALAEWWGGQLKLPWGLENQSSVRSTFVDIATKAFGNARVMPFGKGSGSALSVWTTNEPQGVLSDVWRTLASRLSGPYGAQPRWLPSSTTTYLHDDGMVFVPDGKGKHMRLAYEGAPLTDWYDPRALNLSPGSPCFRAEEIRRIIPLEGGEGVSVVTLTIFNTNRAESSTAQPGDVLVVPLPPAMPLNDFVRLSAADLKSPTPSLVSALHYTSVCPAGNARTPPPHITAEQIDARIGLERRLSPVFRVLTLQRPASVGLGEGYSQLNPGDFLMQSVNPETPRYGVARALWIRNGTLRWLPATPNGRITSYEPFKP